jgi:predicted kinase
MNLLNTNHLTNFDFEALTARYDWLQIMKNCPQSPIHHAEGNVWIHTGMVMQELLNSPNFKSYTQKEQLVLFASCLLHDVAKPICTEISATGEITSAGHARMGEGVSRRILTWEDYSITLAERELICQLVRYHGLPLWFLEKQNPEEYVIRASYRCNMRLLYEVAMADVKGRICENKPNVIEKVELFKMFCEDLGCWDTPKKFASEHTRFQYFQKEGEGISPDFPLFDDTHGTVYMMCGVPGSGKDTYIQKKLHHLPQVSLDNIRKELDISFKDNQGLVIQTAENYCKIHLRKREDFVFNATNITRQLRKKWVDLFSDYKAKIVIIFINISLQKAIVQNRQRTEEKLLKDKVIENYFEKFELPDLTECYAIHIL